MSIQGYMRADRDMCDQSGVCVNSQEELGAWLGLDSEGVGRAKSEA